MTTPRHYHPEWRLWTRGESVQWWRFFRGDIAEMPEGRTLDAARRKLKPLGLDGLSQSQLHAMSMAAAKYFPAIPFTRPQTLLVFIEDVQILAVSPHRLASRDWPAEAFQRAVIDARKALYSGIPLGETQPVDTSHATR